MKKAYFALLSIPFAVWMFIALVKTNQEQQKRMAALQVNTDKLDLDVRAIKSAIATTSGRVTQPTSVVSQPEMVVYGDVPLPAEEVVSTEVEPPHYYAPGSPSLDYQNSWADKGYRIVRTDLKTSPGRRTLHRNHPRVGTYQLPVGGSVTVLPTAYHRHRSYGQRHYRSRGYSSYRAPYRSTCHYLARGYWTFSSRGRLWIRPHYVPCACR